MNSIIIKNNDKIEYLQWIKQISIDLFSAAGYIIVYNRINLFKYYYILIYIYIYIRCKYIS